MSNFTKAALVVMLTSTSITTAHATFAEQAYMILTKSITAAIGVTSKQTAASATQMVASKQLATQQVVNAIGAQNTTARVSDMMLDRVPVFGRPDSTSCQKVTDRHAQVVQADLSKLAIQNAVAGLSSTQTTSRPAAEAAKLSRHLTAYCTATEARAGRCIMMPFGLAAADTDYARISSFNKVSNESAAAGMDYVALVADRRTTVDVNCKSDQCRSAQTVQMSNNAASSMVATSLVTQIMSRTPMAVTEQR